MDFLKEQEENRKLNSVQTKGLMMDSVIMQEEKNSICYTTQLFLIL